MPAYAATRSDELAFVRKIALALLVLIIVDVSLTALYVGFGFRLGFQLVWNLVLLGLMVNGANWARWVFAIGNGIWSVVGIFTAFNLPEPIGFFSILGLWLLVSSLAGVAIAAMLMFSDRVNRFFGT